MKNKTKFFAIVVFFLGITLTQTSFGGGHTVTKVIKRHNPKGAWLGVYMKDPGTSYSKNNNEDVTGAYVEQVVEDSPAEKAGIQEGDIIVKFDGSIIDDADDLTSALHNAKPDAEVIIEVMRDDSSKKLTATLTKSSEDREMGAANMMLRNVRPPMAMTIVMGNGANGITVQDLTEQFAEFLNVPEKKGVLVTEVEKESEAEKAGLKAGDVITKVGDKKVISVDKFNNELEKLDNGDDAKFDVVRKGANQTLTMKVEKEKSFSSSFSNSMGIPHVYDLNIDGSDDEQSMRFMRAPRGMNPEQLDELRQNLDELKMELKELKKKLKMENKD